MIRRVDALSSNESRVPVRVGTSHNDPVVRIRLPDLALRDVRYLASQERLVMMIRQHWIRLVPSFLLVAVLAAFVQFGDTEVRDAFPGFIPATVGVLVLWFTVDWNLRHIMITDRRLIIVSGLVWRRTRSFPLGSICRVEYTRGPFARLLGYGSIMLLPAGRLGGLWLNWLPRPDRIYLIIMDMLYGGPPSPVGDDSETAATAADTE